MQENDPHSTTLFAELLLPVPVPALFTYRVPAQFNELIQPGQRAIVPFGDRKVLTGVIVSLSNQPPREFQAKSMLELLDTIPAVNHLQLRFFQWLGEYYMCTSGEVLNAALPSGLKLSSESKVQLNPTFDLDESDHLLSEKELILLRRLQHGPLEYTEISKLLEIKTVYNILKSLVRKDAVILFEEVKEKYKPLVERRIRLTGPYNNAEALETLFEKVAAKPKQEALLLRYLQLVPVLQSPDANTHGCSRRVMFTDVELSESSLKTLIKQNVFEEFDRVISRFDLPDHHDEVSAAIALSEEQQQAMNAVMKAFETHSTTLLHGITGSGKTEIYINLIRNALQSGTQVLYLLPEIALTTQIVQRLRKIFGKQLGIYHSKFSDNERVEVWNGILSGKFKFVVGVRSSIFLPFDNLGLVIVDEEHETSYKQQEPAPRYNARDAAIMLAHLHHAKTLLGSATPSVDTILNARQNRYGYVALTKRFGEASLPQIRIADMGMERKRKTIKGEFSGLLLRSIHDTLAKGEQVIIFQNRRGYSPVMSCEDCGWVPQCVNCAVSLTYHQYRHALVCHYCGYREKVPVSCTSCSSTRLKTVGYGTEKLEEELTFEFPEVRIRRMDLDTTRSKTGYETIIREFEQGETRILVGTQMVTKGLDFDNVSLVGIFNADRMMHFPDFRSHERAFQLMTQVSGRAGRRDKSGTVVIQTSSPTHPLLHLIINNDLERFYEQELRDRQLHGYPPFTRLIEITVKHIDKKNCVSSANAFAGILREQLNGVRILGPAEPLIGKIRNLFLMTILVKIPKGKTDLATTKASILSMVEKLNQEKEHRNSRFVIDVDPL